MSMSLYYIFVKCFNLMVNLLFLLIHLWIQPLVYVMSVIEVGLVGMTVLYFEFDIVLIKLPSDFLLRLDFAMGHFIRDDLVRS